MARASGKDLAEALELIVREVRPERLWVVANSMGAQVVVDALPILHEREVTANTVRKPAGRCRPDGA